ncbi:MAG: DUF2442 domain-containing protein [Beijerinckiaceae bacterium]
MIPLGNGAVVGFPLSFLPGLEQASPEGLCKIEVKGGGYGLHVLPLMPIFRLQACGRIISARRS